MDLFRACELFVKNGDYEKGYECIRNLYNETKDRSKVVEYRKWLMQNLDDAGDYLRLSYTLTGKESFDDFMIAIEWRRAPKERFWLPRRKHLMKVCNALEDLENDKLDELFVSMPPRVGKTTVVNMFIVWVILRNSERSNLYTSYTDKPVERFYQGIMEILNDPITYDWKSVFGERQIVSQDGKDYTLNVDRRKRYASFTGRSLYGSLNGACDCNGYAVADDIHSGIEEALNIDRLNSAWYRVDNNFLPRAKEQCKKLWIGTRWSVGDAIARRIDLLENDPRFKSVRYRVFNIPALDENDESNFDYSYGVGFSTDYFLQRRASFERNDDLASWYAQYQGAPVERSGTVFAPNDLRYYNGVLPDGDPDRIFMAVDPAWGGGDFTASPIVYQYGKDLFVHDVVYTNGDKKESIPTIALKAKNNKVGAIYIEATKMTASYAEEVAKMLPHVNVQISLKHWTGNGKEQRIFDKSPDIKEHMLFLSQGVRAKDYEKFMQNVLSFHVTGKNKHDDAPDSLCMAMSMVMMPQSVELYDRVF